MLAPLLSADSRDSGSSAIRSICEPFGLATEAGWPTEARVDAAGDELRGDGVAVDVTA
ncbi:MAG: hypothetical protein JNL97_14605 [Verrucomicrobiales bacterium]|nr:hypothetical protein [Verrucomicrobiales bacterium]